MRHRICAASGSALRTLSVLAAVGLAAALAPSTALAAAISFAGTYTQNFDSLPVVAASPNQATWVQESTLPGWSLYSVTSADAGGGVATDAPNITTSAGGTSTGTLYNYGTSSSDTDRSLGSICSDTFPGAQATNDAKPSIYYVAHFVNNTGQDLSAVNIGYTGEEWRAAASQGSQSLTVQTFVGASPDQSRAPGFGGWSSAIASLEFDSPTAGGASSTALNGHLAANSVTIAPTSIPLSVPAGSDFYIRWRDSNDSGVDHALAINNLTVAVAPEPVVLAPALILVGLLRRRRSI